MVVEDAGLFNLLKWVNSLKYLRSIICLIFDMSLVIPQILKKRMMLKIANENEIKNKINANSMSIIV